MKTWPTKKLGEICDFQGGSQPPKKHFSYHPKEGYVRFLQIRDFASDKNITYIPKSEKNRLCNEDDILIGRYGASVGKILINKKGAYNVAIIKTIPNLKVLDKKFFYYYLISKNFQENLLKVAARSAQAGFSKEDIHDFPVFTPPLPEQHRIIKLLDEAFAQIAKAKANTEKNLQNSRELFESYLQSVFRTLKKEIKLGGIANIIGGYSFKSVDFEKQGRYQVIRMGNVRPGVIRPNESPVFINKIDDKVLKRALLLPNDVIITQTGTKNKRDYGFTAIVDKNNYLLNQRISAIRFPNSYLPKFFLYFSWTKHFKDQYFANESGTVGQGNVSINAILNSKIPCPKLSEQKAIVKKLDALAGETKKLEEIYRQKMDDLEELKKSILKKAFEGEL